MAHRSRNHHLFRGLLQSEDGLITRVLKSGRRKIVFETTFGLRRPIAERLRDQPGYILFSERSRIARLGVQIESMPVSEARLCSGQAVLTLEASSVIPGYPGLNELRGFFKPGFPVGRLVYCDPEALLSSEEVLEAVERAILKLPASTSISSDGSIVIAPHKIACRLKEPLTKELLGRILQRDDGRELLNRYQARDPVPAVTIAPGEGLVTTCSMYLNEHFVVLQSGFSLGRNLAATVLDPIKTRGIRIYLEIINQSEHPIVNPLITAKVYRAAVRGRGFNGRRPAKGPHVFSYGELRNLSRRFQRGQRPHRRFAGRPVAVVNNRSEGLKQAPICLNGPKAACSVFDSGCSPSDRKAASQGAGPQRCAADRLPVVPARSAVVVANYFPNLIEHRDLINLTCDGKIEALYFMEPSCEHGPFLSQMDHNRLLEYHAFGLEVYWVSGLTRRLMVHTMRDGMGYFVVPERLADFHKSMLFALYGSNQQLSPQGEARLGELMDALIGFWGRSIGIVTGGGSGVMEQANRLARQRGILSGANFLEITDQSMTTDVDFCQMFQSTCRHSRQKWFEIASFPIFNVGGLGSLEELGITLCNMKLSIIEPVPVILFDTENSGAFWQGIQQQVAEMVRQGRAPAWAADSLVITADPRTVIRNYRERLQLL